VCSLFRPVTPNEASSSRVTELEAEKAELTKQLSSFRSQNSSLLVEVDRVKKDQEDLLVLLADQDTHVKKYKDRLKSLGQMVL